MISNLSEQEVGRISKTSSNVGKEFFTDGDRFVIDFPPNCPREMKVFLRLERNPLRVPIAGNHPGRCLPL